MTGAAQPAAPSAPPRVDAGWRRTVRDRPLIPLGILLVLLVVALEVVKPGTVNATWLATRSSRTPREHRTAGRSTPG